jgi:hypothetical protein
MPYEIRYCERCGEAIPIPDRISKASYAKRRYCAKCRQTPEVKQEYRNKGMYAIKDCIIRAKMQAKSKKSSKPIPVETPGCKHIWSMPSASDHGVYHAECSLCHEKKDFPIAKW